jgi:Na+-driven multidrug efflux pump
MLNIVLPFLPFVAYTTFVLNIIKGFNRFDLALYVRFFGSLIFFVSIYSFYLFGLDGSSIVYAFDLAFVSMAILGYFYKRRLIG